MAWELISLSNSNSEENSEDNSNFELSDLKIPEEQRQEYIDYLSFEKCREIKQAGELYREHSLEEVSNKINKSKDDTEDLLKKYIVLVKKPSSNMSLVAIEKGTKYFGGRNPLEDLIEESGYEKTKLKEYIQEFVGATLKEKELESVDLDQEIPKEIVQPEASQKIGDIQPPGLNLPTDLLKNISEQYKIPNKKFFPALQSLFNQEQFKKSIGLPEVDLGIKVPKISPSKQVQEMFREQNETFQRLFEMGNILEKTFEPVRESLKGLQEHFKKVQRAVEEGISNFEEPEDYDPEGMKLSSLAKKTGKRWAVEFTWELEDADIEELDPYLERIELALSEYKDENPALPIFFFVSMQDGLMHWLCEKDSSVSPDDHKNGSDIYFPSTKQDVLKDKYDDFFGIEVGDFVRNLDSFYSHRCAIMHGDPIAHYDMNIATIALLFFDLTLFTVLKEAGVFDED